MNSQMVLYEEEYLQIVGVCDALHRDACAKAVFLVDLYTPSGTLFDRLGDADHTREKERC